MNKSIVLGLLLAMMVPAVALADGVTVGGDLRLRWNYNSDDDGSGNSTQAVTNIGLAGAVSDNVSFTASLRNAMSLGQGGGALLDVQEVYASIADLGGASGVLSGWSLDVGRMTKPTYGSGRVMNGDDWGFGAPESADGYHAASEMGGIGVDFYLWGGDDDSEEGSAGSGNSTFGAVFDLGDLGGFADISVGFWGYDRTDDVTTINDNGTPSDPSDDFSETEIDGVTSADSNLSVNIDNIGGDSLAGIDFDVEYATSGGDQDGDSGADEDGTMTTLSVSYDLGDMGMSVHASNSVTDADWRASVSDPHGTHGIADLFSGADLDNTTIGLSFSPMDGVDASVNFITIASDSTGDDIGSEIDVVIDWACGADMDMQIGWASYTADDDAAALQDTDFFYLQTGWSF